MIAGAVVRSTGVKRTISESISGAVISVRDRLRVLVRTRGRDHVDRIANARHRRQGRREGARVSVGERRERQPSGFARVGGKDARPAGVGEDRDAASGRQRLQSRHEAMSNISSIVSARMTPDCANSASTGASLAASAAVWLPAAREPGARAS